MCFVHVISVFCSCFVRVVHCLCFSDQHTASQHVFPSRVVRNRSCTYSMSQSENREKVILDLLAT